MRKPKMDQINRMITRCGLCPRLREHCEQSAKNRPRRYSRDSYFIKPVPNFGDPGAKMLIVGLAPAAHGANRTGRMFTGDRSGDWLYQALYDSGFGNQPTATDLNDGLALSGAMITAAGHCAPPQNKPTSEELNRCAPFLDQTFDALADLQVVVCLGRIGFESVLKRYRRQGKIKTLSAYKFAHGAVHEIDGVPVTICSYHPSQQNTFTGRLTREMLLDVFIKARSVINQAG